MPCNGFLEKGDKMAVPVTPDFAAGLAAAVGQLSSALKLPREWVASPSLRWTPSGATLLVRWGPASGRAPGGGEKTKRKRSKAQQARSRLRAAAHKTRKAEQQHQQRGAAGLRPEATAYVPPNSDAPVQSTAAQQATARSMEVEQVSVSEGRELLERPVATTHAGSAQTQPQLTLVPPPPDPAWDLYDFHITPTAHHLEKWRRT